MRGFRDLLALGSGLSLICVLLASGPACGPAARDGNDAFRQATPAGPLFAAMLRSDARLVPFAVFENGSWRAPVSVLYAQDDAGLSAERAAWFQPDGKAPATWTVRQPGEWSPPGPPPSIATAGEPVATRSHCTSYWALPTGARGQPLEQGQVHRVVGAALSGAWPLHPAADMDAAAAEREALTVIGPVFESAEQKAAAERLPGLYEPRQVGAGAAKSPLSLEKLVRAAGGDGWQVYAFEAVRTYARPPGGSDRGCDEATVMTGWLLEDASGRLSVLGSTTTLTDCDRKGSERIVPLAYTAIAGRTYLLVIAHHWESEDYRIYAVDGRSIKEVARAEGGGC